MITEYIQRICQFPCGDNNHIQLQSLVTCTTVEVNCNMTESMRWLTCKQGRGHVIDDLNLNKCLCGEVVDPSMEGVVKCKRISCETQGVSAQNVENLEVKPENDTQYHISCVGGILLPRNWLCEACEASGPSRKGKRSCRWHHITIFRHVPDYIS